MKIFAFLGWLLFACSAQANTLHILCYHDVRAKESELTDPYGVTVSQLATHFAWLKREGFNVVDVNAIVAAQRGEKSLPEKAVLITFDDGLASVYESAFPLLQAFNYPAVVTVVGSWLNEPSKMPLRYGNKAFSREMFLSLEQLRALAKSPLIEIGSHSYDLHQGLLANDAGLTQPAAVVRIWDSRLRARESDAAYERRLREDLEKNVDFIEKHTGKKPRVMAWPFGEYTGTGARIARDLGLNVGVTLTEGTNVLPGPTTSMKRILISTRTDVARLGYAMSEREHAPVRFFETRLDEMLDASNAARETFLDALFERISQFGATHVVVPGWSMETKPRALFETKSVAHVNLLNRVAWQMRTRLGVKVFVRWPMPQTDAAFAPGAEHLVSFEDLLDTVSLAGVVLDFGSQPFNVSRYKLLATLVRDAHPDDEIVIAASDAGPITHEQINRSLLPELRVTASIQPIADHKSAPVNTPVNLRNSTWLEFDGQVKDPAQLVAQMRALQAAGWLNFGWRNDDIKNNFPPINTVAPAFSRRAGLR